MKIIGNILDFAVNKPCLMLLLLFVVIIIIIIIIIINRTLVFVYSAVSGLKTRLATICSTKAIASWLFPRQQIRSALVPQ